MSLSAAIIVKDDADRLDACLTSLRGLVDEIVVVDTGSSDRSVAWPNSTAPSSGTNPGRATSPTPRNRSLDLATGDWVLSVDADEQVERRLRRRPRHLAAADDCVGFRVRFVPRVGWTPFREYRLWRNRPDIRFEGHIHETVVAAIQGAADADGLRIDPFDRFTIRRSGDEGDRADTRARDEPLLLAELARHPDRPFVYDHLARVYEARGTASARSRRGRKASPRVARAHRGAPRRPRALPRPGAPPPRQRRGRRRAGDAGDRRARTVLAHTDARARRGPSRVRHRSTARRVRNHSTGS